MTYEYEIKLNDQTYYVELEGRVDVDNNYGADADGNRGTTAYFAEVDSFKAFTYGFQDAPIEVVHPGILEVLQEKAENMMVEECI
jgi:hypothetical protein